MSSRFSSNTTDFITSYLSNPLRCVSYSGYSSSIFITSSGVSQELELRPLLFNMYVNDVLLALKCNTYTDNLKIISRIVSVKIYSDLQKNLNITVDWCNLNSISLNIDILPVVSCTKIRNPVIVNNSISQLLQT